MVSQIGSKWSTSNIHGSIRPIKDTLKSTVALGIEKLKRLKETVPELKMVPHVKSVNIVDFEVV